MQSSYSKDLLPTRFVHWCLQYLDTSDDDGVVLGAFLLALVGVDEQYDTGDEEDCEAEPGYSVAEAEHVIRVRRIHGR